MAPTLQPLVFASDLDPLVGPATFDSAWNGNASCWINSIRSGGVNESGVSPWFAGTHPRRSAADAGQDGLASLRIRFRHQPPTSAGCIARQLGVRLQHKFSPDEGTPDTTMRSAEIVLTRNPGANSSLKTSLRRAPDVANS